MYRRTGEYARSNLPAKKETSRAVELLAGVQRGHARLGAQIEGQLRGGIRDGALRPGTQLPSTRDLARQLGVSRRIVVDAYQQLAAEGYLELRQGARPQIAETCAGAEAPIARRRRLTHPRFDFRPSRPDLPSFPRAMWLRSLRSALSAMKDAELDYGDPRGSDTLREVMAGYLGRVRGVVADPARIVITAGYTQGLGLVCRALAAAGARRIAIETPSNREQLAIVERAGLEPVAIRVDAHGLCTGELARIDAGGVVVTPAHQHPTGVVMSGERRAQLLAWLRERNAYAIEDDYDAEYRYDRAPVGALQGLEPDRVIYAGTAAKTLSPALRLGWLVAPPALVDAVAREKQLADRGTARIDQHALADFVARGELDRHLRKMRLLYRARRDAIIGALAQALPRARLRGIAAGLHVTVELRGASERAIRRAAADRRIVLESQSDFEPDAPDQPAILMLGYGSMSEPSLRAGVAELAAAIAAAR
jgi:GntR family transcriptional regulator/MocR family aminotransferase